TMGAFSEERKMGTLELLMTKPISLPNIVLGKYFGAVTLIVIALIPSLLYVATISDLGNPAGNWDVGSTIGSYIGLFFLACSYTAIGIYASSLSKNQIVSFIIAVFTCFLLYFGFEGLSDIFPKIDLSHLGIKSHFNNLSRGVLGMSDVLYFIGLSLVFLSNTMIKLRGENYIKKKDYGYIPLAVIPTLILILGITNFPPKRIDLTQDQRYTLSDAAKETISSLDSPITIDIFLDGELPSEFKRLKVETEQLLSQFQSENNNITYQFINPLDESVDQTAIQQQMSNMGLKGANVEIRENGKISNEVVYPWALAYHNDKTIPIGLLKNQLGATQEERVQSSIQNLEYAFADGFSKLTQPKRRKVAVIKGNGELDNRYLADFITALRDYYYIGQFTMDSVAVSPQRTLESISDYDLAIIAQPTQTFSEEDKYVLDQFTMRGGSSLWLLDATTQRLDTVSGNTFVFGQDLGLNDFFFKYGIRVNQNLVKDIYAAPIALATGQGSDSQYQRYPWLYNPLSASGTAHPITSNIEAVKFEYASSIDTLPNSLKKTVLLSSSPISKVIGLPVQIDLDKEIPNGLKIINEGPDPREFNAGETPLAVLLEGEFTSVYANRIKPFKTNNASDKSGPNKIVVISDGDIIKNQLDRGRPLELGFDKWTNAYYGNKDFLINTVNYLLDDSGLINIRSKEIAVPFLDPQKTNQKRTQWQVINLLLPLVLLGVFGVLFYYFRRKKYGQPITA
ncbi:MAG: gliding motility-associated ABC transporter substrate-binding protein GldG, partial [Bacteroidetes bacterium]|nr:gliding motility-associated ABC transporter substrate-binding protein GldG [Bacteroidota bacterium]